MPLLKQLPVDTLYILAKTGTKVLLDTSIKKNAYFSITSNTISMSPELADDVFTFMHEFGHMLDYEVMKDLHSDPQLKDIFLKELENYKNQASNFNELEIAYFVSKNHPNSDGCLTEVIAEATAIITSGVRTSNFLVMRAKLLQENFPETLSYIGSKIEEFCKPEDINTKKSSNQNAKA